MTPTSATTSRSPSPAGPWWGRWAGDRFDHHLSLVPRQAPCQHVQAVANRGWLVTTAPSYVHRFVGLAPFDANFCMGGTAPRFTSEKMHVYAPPTRPVAQR